MNNSYTAQELQKLVINKIKNLNLTKQSSLELLNKLNFNTQEHTLEIDKIIEYNYFKSRGIEDAMEFFLGVLERHNVSKDFIINPNLLPESIELTKHHNIFDIFRRLNIDKQILITLANLKLSKRSISRGAWEVPFCALFRDINPMNKCLPGTDKAGDIHTGSGSYELKDKYGRLINNNSYNLQYVENTFKKLIKERLYINLPEKSHYIINKHTNLYNTISWILTEYPNIDKYELLEIIAESMFSMVKDMKQISDYNNELKLFLSFTKKYADYFLEGIKINDYKKEKASSNFSMLWGVLDMRIYGTYLELFDHMIIFSKNPEKIGEYAYIGKSIFKSYDSLFEFAKQKLIFMQWPVGTGRSTAFQMLLK